MKSQEHTLTVMLTTTNRGRNSRLPYPRHSGSCAATSASILSGSAM